ncbi:MAG TPA: DUF4199 domain-containing protein [Bacteroidales bacterium]|nr:DUF4199 domain-containing protein [Bacteroidales bacterium]
MEEKINPWKANLTSGLILGLASVIFTLLLWILDLYFNKGLSYIFILISVFLIYYFIKSYRDNYLHGRITYGQSLGAGVIISIYYALVTAVFTYILFVYIDPGLVEKSLAKAEEQLIARGGLSEDAIAQAMSMQEKLMSPAIVAPLSILGSVFFGTLASLLVSIFTRKEGNPLIDSPEN